MRKILITVIAACIGLAGSAPLATAELLSAKRTIIAILAVTSEWSQRSDLAVTIEKLCRSAGISGKQRCGKDGNNEHRFDPEEGGH